MMKKRYRACATVITTFMLLLSTGAAFARNMPKLVLNDHPVYTRWDAGKEKGGERKEEGRREGKNI